MEILLRVSGTDSTESLVDGWDCLCRVFGERQMESLEMSPEEFQHLNIK